MHSYDEALSHVLDLVERFERNLDSYKNGSYNETQVRREFIDPFFDALGWDIGNKGGYAEQYKDVVHEDAVKIGISTKAPDYSFRIGGQRKFFLEAKKPSVNIKGDPAPAYQLRRYAWSAKLPVSILTDFEEFAVYDCTAKPSPKDAPATGRVNYYTFREYPDKFKEIYDVFAKESVLRGSFDRHAAGAKGKRGTGEVDAEFLKVIEGWRLVLARELARKNPSLGIHELNFAVQQTIDRITFLRIAEDRGIEPYGGLQSLENGANVYARLLRLYDKADTKYNSGLFDFKADTLSHSLAIDDKVLKDIIASLYFPSPYEFSVIGAEILGSVYEQFLGKVIRLTAGHQAKVEEKPEVKKAGGVYYTPSFVVDYIVKNTVGRWLTGKTPKQASALTVLDPACGSGSFLLRAYQYLLDWHLSFYVKDGPERHAKGKSPALYQSQGGWRLTTVERKRILTNNIFGVDIDRQAVEVTKLSLLLKVLEGESEQTLRTLNLFGERALPSLEANIKCGNSLIGPDFYAGESGALFADEEAVRRVNVFDWGAEFPAIMKAGGFDCVVGNPPYVRPHNLEPAVKEYFWGHYSSFVKKSDLYCCFVERSISLLRQNGAFGFIISNGWLRLDSFDELRKLLLAKTSLRKIIDFPFNVFERANVKTSILLFDKKINVGQKVEVATCKNKLEFDEPSFATIEQRIFSTTYKNIFDLSITRERESIVKKIQKKGTSLGDSYDISFGLKTGDDSKFLTFTNASSEHKPLLRGSNVHKYSASFKGEYVWYVPDKMFAHRRTARPGNAERFEQPKILIRDTGHCLEGTYDGEGYYVKDVLVISSKGKEASELLYLTGILNSKPMRYFYETSFPTIHVQRDELASLPIRPIDFSDKKDKARHDRMVSLVERMLELNRKLAQASMPADKDLYKRQIEQTDKEIDGLTYELYGLTEDEIRVVEGKE